jgi:hypothetical protein
MTPAARIVDSGHAQRSGRGDDGDRFEARQFQNLELEEIVE